MLNTQSSKEELGYRLPDVCCATCDFSYYDRCDEPACHRLKTIAKPFPYRQDNTVDLGGVCNAHTVEGVRSYD